MNTPGNDDYISVPEPLFKYEGGKVIHEHNKAIIDSQKAPAILTRREYNRARKELKRISKRLKKSNVDELRKELVTLDLQLGKLNQLQAECDKALADIAALGKQMITYDSWCAMRFVYRYSRALVGRCDAIQRRAVSLAGQVANVKSELAPHQQDIQRREQLKQKLESHRAAVEDERKQNELQLAMAEEAKIVAQQIQRTLARLGFKHTYTKRNKNVTDLVEFDYVVVTPDQLQFKLAASKRGLFGGSIDLLPEGVRVMEILKDNVMAELTSVLEREVWNPHTNDRNIPLVNGAWIIVERLGLVEGIPTHVTYRQLMARYETARHELFPIPGGLKRGRRINWVYLDSSAGIHFMFSGISGSGKSNAMRASIAALVEKQSPADVQFVFIDLKRQGDFREFEQAPHCVRIEGNGVLTSLSDVYTALQRIEQEMLYRQVEIGRVTNSISDYNKRYPDNKMPRIMIVFDEFAAVAGSNADRSTIDEIFRIVNWIGQQGRSSGIHLGLGIQQPTRDNMPQRIRYNVTTHFAGFQSTAGASMSATGNRSAMKIAPIPGRMEATVGAFNDEVQMPFITDGDVANAVALAVQKYGNDNPYTLHYSDDAITETAPEMSDEQLILDIAFREFGGDLVARPIWEIVKGQLSQSVVYNIVKEISSKEIVEYHGKFYQPQRHRTYYILKELETESDTSLETEYMAS